MSGQNMQGGVTAAQPQRKSAMQPGLPATLDYSDLPEELRGGMQRYYEHGIQPGSFMTAVLGNDLMESFNRANVENTRDMHTIVRWIYQQMPRGSYGSPEVVKRWINMHAECRTRAASDGGTE